MESSIKTAFLTALSTLAVIWVLNQIPETGNLVQRALNGN
jgi:hypothetical protein